MDRKQQLTPSQQQAEQTPDILLKKSHIPNETHLNQFLQLFPPIASQNKPYLRRRSILWKMGRLGCLLTRITIASPSLMITSSGCRWNPMHLIVTAVSLVCVHSDCRCRWHWYSTYLYFSKELYFFLQNQWHSIVIYPQLPQLPENVDMTFFSGSGGVRSDIE